MASIMTAIQLQDRITPVIQNITSAMSIMVTTFQDVQNAASSHIDTAVFDSIRNQINAASAELARFREESGRTGRRETPTPAAPQWQPISGQEVFTNTGADRFASEVRAANNAMQEVITTQSQITQQAQHMDIVPPGMMNDINSVQNRIQMLGSRISQLNNIPVNLRTGAVNNEIEMLRGQIGQAAVAQQALNQAMRSGDLSQINAAYQRLNNIVGATERNIRDNTAGQEQFNQSLRSGQTAASGLESKIKGYAAAILSVATAGKIIKISDEFTQTTARLENMNYGLDNTEQLQQKIFASAQRARGSYQNTANFIARLGNNASEAFTSNDELIAFAEQVNKQFAISGAGPQEQAAASLQLSQALASGVLRGDELNSIFEQAPSIMRSVAKYMGQPIGKMRELAKDGKITADIMKNAMFNSAAETNKKFESMPMTFAQVMSNIKNQALKAFQPVLDKISAITKSADFNAMVSNVVNGIATLANYALLAFDTMGAVAAWAQQNWSWLAPLVGGLVAAFVTYRGILLAVNIVTGIKATLDKIAAASATLHAGKTLAEAAAATTATGAQAGLNLALLACPITWIVIGIAALVAAIAIWVRKVGGIKIAWLTCLDKIMTAWGIFQLTNMKMVVSLMNAWDMVSLGLATVWYGILNGLGNLKITGLNIIQDFVNGAIDRINKLIETVNSIVGTTFQLMGYVELGTNAAVEEQAKQAARAKEIAESKVQNAMDKVNRRKVLAEIDLKNKAAAKERRADIEKAKAEAKKGKGDEDNSASSNEDTFDYTGNLKSINADTKAIKNSVATTSEDLKYLRDIATQKSINRFTTAEIKVNMTNNNKISSEMDIQTLSERLRIDVENQMFEAAVWGAH